MRTHERQRSAWQIITLAGRHARVALQVVYEVTVIVTHAPAVVDTLRHLLL